jgi:hypothetical protein
MDENYHLLSREDIKQIASEMKLSPEVLGSFEENLNFLEKEIEPMFRERDYEASKARNNYQLTQLGFVILSILAALIGSFILLSVNDAPDITPYLAFGETVVALLITYLATISGRTAPMAAWYSNRRRAEQLRREYFRFLMHVEPYSNYDGFQRRRLLSRRAADINRGLDIDVR